MKKMIFGAALAAATFSTAPAMAATFDLAADFGNAAFKYGTISPTGTFTAFGATDCSAIGIVGTCYRGGDTFQVIGLHNASQLIVHPGPGATDTTAVVFTAPTSGTYTLNLDFVRGDTGDGITVFGYLGSALVPLAAVNGAMPSYSISNLFLSLNAGDQIGFAIDRGPNDYFNDSTFVSGSISVPEPATWGLMILGFGAAGAALRRRNAIRTSVRYA